MGKRTVGKPRYFVKTKYQWLGSNDPERSFLAIELRPAATRPIAYTELMKSAAIYPYEAPTTLPEGREAILGAAAEIKKGIRRDRRRKSGWYASAVVCPVLASSFACGCGAPTLWEGLKLNLAPAAFLVMTLAGIVCGLGTSLRISRARRELMLLADRFEATFFRERVP
jgi:hypothetical protein